MTYESRAHCITDGVDGAVLVSIGRFAYSARSTAQKRAIDAVEQGLLEPSQWFDECAAMPAYYVVGSRSG